MTVCPKQKLLFQPHGRREVVAEFERDFITSDAGALLLREVEQRFGIVRQFEACFTDHRSKDAIEFTTLELLLQRVMGLALGDEDLNDYDLLRHDPLLALVCGRQDVPAQDRVDERDRGKPARVFKDFEYRTHKSWSASRRVIGRAEHWWKGPNPRFIVTNLTAEEMAAQPLYEVGDCGRGDMENRIKEQQLFLFADRTSTHSMRRTSCN